MTTPLRVGSSWVFWDKYDMSLMELMRLKLWSTGVPGVDGVGDCRGNPNSSWPILRSAKSQETNDGVSVSSLWYSIFFTMYAR